MENVLAKNAGAAFKRSPARLATGYLLLLLCIMIWIPSGDVIDMIIRQKEIIFGRYSRGHFAGLFVLSLVLLGLAALCFSRIQTAGEMLAVSLMVAVSTLLGVFILVVGSGWAAKPRYVERVVEQREGEVYLQGLVRHRSSREFYQLVQVDKPEQKRSYPAAPPGYPTFNLTLSTDQYGFRNAEVNGKLPDHYPLLAVGDSFVAGSHVSDEQAWVQLLSRELDTDIYNLGVSGSDPGNYYNNFILLGRQFKPRHVLFMLYEGNDFKKVSPLVTEQARDAGDKISRREETTLGDDIAQLAAASPVTLGLRRFSSEVLETLGSDASVKGYQEQVGFMPLRWQGEHFVHYYGFDPKRLMYLYVEKTTFQQSASWQQVALIMEKLVARGKLEGYEVSFLYAPSTPHVVMPLMKEQIPAQQLHNFAAYDQADLPDAETFKHTVFAWIDNQQQVFLEHCARQQYRCLALTEALQSATAAGQQLYYSYDQHWTPQGNQVVARAVADWLRAGSPAGNPY